MNYHTFTCIQTTFHSTIPSMDNVLILAQWKLVSLPVLMKHDFNYSIITLFDLILLSVFTESCL